MPNDTQEPTSTVTKIVPVEESPGVLPDAPPTEATSPEPASPDTVNDADQKHRDILNDLMGKGPKAEKPKEDDPAGDEQEKIVEPEANADDDDDDAKAPKIDGKIEPIMRGKYTNALKRDGWQDEWLGNLDESRLSELGKSAIKRQAKQDDYGNEVGRIKNVLDELGYDANGKQKHPAQDANQGEPKASDNQLPTYVNEFVDSLKDDDLYGDIADPIGKVFASFHAESQKQASDLREELSSRDAQINGLYDSLESLMLQNTRQSLLSEIPELADHATFEKVQELVYEMVDVKGYRNENGNADTHKLFRDAANIVIGPLTKQKMQQQLIQRQKKQLAGQPAASTERSTPLAAMTIEQKSRLAMQRLAKGEKPEDINRDLRSII